MLCLPRKYVRAGPADRLGFEPSSPPITTGLRTGLGRLRRLRPAPLADMLETASADEQADIVTQVHPDPELEASRRLRPGRAPVRGSSTSTAPRTRAARPGGWDLVFWTDNGEPSGIHHVAIYLGDNQIVEAANSEDDLRVRRLGSESELLSTVSRIVG